MNKAEDSLEYKFMNMSKDQHMKNLKEGDFVFEAIELNQRKETREERKRRKERQE